MQAFTNAAGQAVLGYDEATDTSRLRLDVNGDGASDFDLLINGRVDADDGWLM